MKGSGGGHIKFGRRFASGEKLWLRRIDRDSMTNGCGWGGGSRKEENKDPEKYKKKLGRKDWIKVR